MILFIIFDIILRFVLGCGYETYRRAKINQEPYKRMKKAEKKVGKERGEEERSKLSDDEKPE